MINDCSRAWTSQAAEGRRRSFPEDTGYGWARDRAVKPLCWKFRENPRVSRETANFSGLRVFRHLCSKFWFSLSSCSKNYAPGKGEGGADPAKASRFLLSHGEAQKREPENHFLAAAVMGFGWVCTSLPGQDQGLNPQNTAGWGIRCAGGGFKWN